MNEKTKKYHNLFIIFCHLFPHFHPFLLFTKTSKYNLMVCFLDLLKNQFFYVFTFYRFLQNYDLSISNLIYPHLSSILFLILILIPDQFPLFTKYTQTMVFFFLSIYMFKYSESYNFEENIKNILKVEMPFDGFKHI